ncbi:hypothetical protein HDU98_010677 [Podochytrium sp. JEL0797]|nr:hypothetical protein HDU98_010677 [Podochytrium sp. JEL0797]
MNTAIPAPPGRWLYVPSAALADTGNDALETASIGYSDFFVSELTSDSEDSDGNKLSLDQRRHRHEVKRATKAQKWAAKTPAKAPSKSPLAPQATTPQATTTAPQTTTTTPQQTPNIDTFATVQHMLDTLALLNTRVTSLLTRDLSSDAALKNAQLQGISAAMNSATFVLDNIEDIDDASSVAGSLASVSIAASKDTAETRAAKLIALADRMRFYGEKLRDQASEEGAHAKSYADKQRDRRVDTVIRRVSREAKKAGI